MDYVPSISAPTGYIPPSKNVVSNPPPVIEYHPSSFSQAKALHNQLPKMSTGYQPRVTGYVTQPSQDNGLAKLVTDLSLPKSELLKFDGDAKNYHSFITNFMLHIGNKVSDPSMKLSYLLQYCEGKVKELIKNCVLMSPDQGYATALDLLKRHFGQNHVVARSYIDGLTKGPPIKPYDVDGLVKFAQEAVNCHLVVGSLNFTNDMDSQDTLCRIIDRLPNHLQTDWIKKAAEIIQKGREPRFSDVCNFIEHRAMIADSVYGRRYAARSKYNEKSAQQHIEHSKPRLSTMATEVSNPVSAVQPENIKQLSSSDNFVFSTTSTQVSNKSVCSYCKQQQHFINKCPKFLSLSYEKRFEFVKENRLCFKCLNFGHKSSDCKVDIKCFKCDRRHNVLLHNDNHQETKQDSQENTVVKSRYKEPDNVQTSAAVNATSVSRSTVYLGIIPVTLKNNDTQVQTYALLDSGSNTSLLKREIYDVLKLQGTPTSYSLQTINNNKSVGQQYKTSFAMLDTRKRQEIQVQALTVDNISVSLNSLPQESDIKKWKHFQGIDIPQIDAKQVGLLIGTDCPSMFWTLEERRGELNEPYARLTLLGWTIIGPAENEDKDEHQVNFIQTHSIQVRKTPKHKENASKRKSSKNLVFKKSYPSYCGLKGDCTIKSNLKLKSVNAVKLQEHYSLNSAPLNYLQYCDFVFSKLEDMLCQYFISPHMGGIFERTVRSVKDTYKSLVQQAMTDNNWKL